jgi:hypothetical protein
VLNNQQKKKANKLLQSQKEQIDSKANDIEAQKEILQQSYSNVELLGEIRPQDHFFLYPWKRSSALYMIM